MAELADVTVVGSGVVALAVAEELLHRGHRVAVAGPFTDTLGQATRAAGAMLSTFSELEPQHSLQRREVETRERIAAHDRYPAWLDRFTDPHTAGLGEGTWVFGSGSQLSVIAGAAFAAGHRAEYHQAADIAGLACPDPDSSVLYLPGERYLDSGALMDELLTAVRKHPRAVCYDTIAVEVDGRRVRCADGTVLTAGIVVLAAGSATGSLAGPASGLPPIFAGRGVSLVLDAPQVPVTQVVRTANQAFACGIHLVPRGGGQVYLGATNRLTTRPDVNRPASLGELGVLAAEAASRLDARLGAAAVAGHRVGYRPYTLDHLPLIGRSAAAGLLVATATYRCGVLLAPRLAQLVADEVGAPGVLDTHPYRALRPMAAPSLAEVLAEGGSGSLLEHLQQAGAVLPAQVAAELSTFLEVALPVLAQHPDGATLARLWAQAPVQEAVPALFSLPGRTNGPGHPDRLARTGAPAAAGGGR